MRLEPTTLRYQLVLPVPDELMKKYFKVLWSALCGHDPYKMDDVTETESKLRMQVDTLRTEVNRLNELCERKQKNNDELWKELRPLQVLVENLRQRIKDYEEERRGMLR